MYLDNPNASSPVRTKGTGVVRPGSGRGGGIFNGLSESFSKYLRTVRTN